MGSVPIHKPKLFLISLLVEFLGLIALLFTKTDDNSWPWLFLLSGFIYYWVIYSKYRNTGARHNHETETKSNMSNLRKVDTFVRKRTRLDSSTMEGANNKSIKGGSKGISFDDVKDLIK